MLELQLEGFCKHLAQTPAFHQSRAPLGEVKELARAHRARWARDAPGPGEAGHSLLWGGGRDGLQWRGQLGKSRCCDAIGLCPHPPFIVSCCREVSPGLGGGEWWRAEGSGLGGARPAGTRVAAPEEDNGCSSPAAERALAQLTGQICLPPGFWLGFHCRAVKSSLCEVKSPRILLPQPRAWGRGWCC